MAGFGKYEKYTCGKKNFYVSRKLVSKHAFYVDKDNLLAWQGDIHFIAGTCCRKFVDASGFDLEVRARWLILIDGTVT